MSENRNALWPRASLQDHLGRKAHPITGDGNKRLNVQRRDRRC